MFKLAVFVSGGGTNLQALLDRIADGTLKNIAIEIVIASKQGTRAQQRAEQAGIDCVVMDRAEYTDTAIYDQALTDLLTDRPVDLIVLAGFMCLLGPKLVQAYRNRIINIHPSLIPAFCGHGLYGIRPHQAALEYGVKLSGATVHFVDEQYDTGPILLQRSVIVRNDDTPELLQKRVMEEAEQIILPQAVSMIAAGRVRIEGRRTVIMEDESK